MEESRLRDKVYRGIYDDITNGILKQNEILTESRLAREYAVSKAPVRDGRARKQLSGLLRRSATKKRNFGVVWLEINKNMIRLKK